MITSTNTRVKASGQFVAVMGDIYTIAGCAFTVPPGKPQPCVRIEWLVPSMRVKVMGKPVLLKSSVGLCLSPEQIPQGPPTVMVTQMRAKGI